MLVHLTIKIRDLAAKINQTQEAGKSVYCNMHSGTNKARKKQRLVSYKVEIKMTKDEE